jgi:hypothetical protein
MRSILILFLIAGLGFTVIVKKDAPKPSIPEKRPEKVSKQTKHNWTKHPLDETNIMAHIAVNERER